MTTTLWFLSSFYLVSLVMNISGVKFEEHCFYISRDIVYSVSYNFSCTPGGVITFLICIIGKRLSLYNEKKDIPRRKMSLLFSFEKPFK